MDLNTVHTVATWIGEQPDYANYWHKTVGLFTDLPHLTVEAVVDVIENAAIFGGAYLLGRRKLRKEHATFDREHGITHDK